MPASDDDELQARLEALEAEVKAESDAKRKAASSAGGAGRGAQAEARVKAQRAKQQAERDDLRERQAAIVKAKSGNRGRDRERDRSGDLETALDLARKGSDAKHELTKPHETGDKSWLISGGLSLFFGPLGWLYAGSWRESVPAGLVWLIAATLLGKILPAFLLMPVLMVAMPISAVAGVVYAIGYNRNHSRIRLFGDDDDKGDDPRIGKLGSGSRSSDDD